VNMHLKGLVEAILFSYSQPVSVKQIQQIVQDHGNTRLTLKDVENILTVLIDEYKGRGINLMNVANGFRFQTNLTYKQELASLHQGKSSKITPAMMETLATIAYKQPITRSEIEEIRGVTLSSYIIKTLTERQWIKVIGQKEVPGRPAMFGTTKIFLSYFGLQSLKQLPQVLPIEQSSATLGEQNIKEPEA